MTTSMIKASMWVLALASLANAEPPPAYGAPSQSVMPQPAFRQSQPQFNSAPQSQQYGAPQAQAQQYSAPAPQPQYNAPAPQAQQYSAPAPQPQYNAPAPQQQQYKAPAPQQQQYNAPAPQPQQQQYNAPAPQPQQYSAPSRQQPQYSAPAPQSQQYGAPQQAQQYSAPAPKQQQQYNAPAPQAPQQYNAPAPQAPQQYNAPAEQSYGAPEEQQPQQPGKVHKHIYVHVAPDETPENRPQRPRKPQPAPEKHYKILFIKAPSPSLGDNEEIQLPPLPETKTLVYVLLKKPEFGNGINIPTPAPTQPSKPEVYFIRYKGGNKEGQQGSQQEYGTPSQAPPQSQYGSPQGAAPQFEQRQQQQPQAPSHFSGSRQGFSQPQYGAPNRA